MLTAIIGHTTRAHQIAALQRELPGAIAFIDDGTLGATLNHRRALAWADDQTVLIIEDDATPTPHLQTGAATWANRHPDRLISLYLGTGRPPAWQHTIADRIAEADTAGRDYIELTQLIHGVAYIAPNPGELAAHIDTANAADFAIGNSWRTLHGTPVIYPTTSLVDHADGPSVEKHPDRQARTTPRHAWRLP